MIYGVNFNGVKTPDHVKGRFAATVRVCKACGGRAPRCCWTAHGRRGRRDVALRFDLKGVGQCLAERDAMLAQASNGHRRLHVEERRTKYGTWYGIYA